MLGAEQRAALNRHLFGRVLNATLGVFKPDRVVVVTADPLLLPLMRGQGLHGLEDTGGGLNAALGLACRYAADARRARHRDPAERSAAWSRPTTSRRSLAALGPAPPLRHRARRAGGRHQRAGAGAARADFFRFGADSFQAHLAAAKARGMPVRILRRPGLAHDLDTPDEYRRFAKDQLARSGALA